MSTKKRSKRQISSYIASARTLAKFAPSLKKYIRRKTLTRWEKGAIARKENILRDAYNLVPVNKKVARKIKDKLFAPGVQAIQLSNTGQHVEVHSIRNDIFITSNGRTWVYWSLPSTTKRSLEKAGEVVFRDPEAAFPIEKIADLAERAFKEAEAKVVYLWASNGRVGDPFGSLKQFVSWLNQYYSAYKHTDKWVNGIAFVIDDAAKPYHPERWELPEEREKRRKQRQEFIRKVRSKRRKGK